MKSRPMSRLNFYLRYAATHLRNNGQWTAFAVFCVAAGVATVVALRSLGLAITDSLLSNLRQYNHGDINISSVSSAGPFSVTFQRGADEPSIFRPQQVEAVRNWAAGRNATLSEYIVASNIQITPAGLDYKGRRRFLPHQWGSN